MLTYTIMLAHTHTHTHAHTHTRTHTHTHAHTHTTHTHTTHTHTTHTHACIHAEASLLPPDCDPLPDIFTGVVVCFHGDSELKSQLSRYIIAYNGDMTDTVDSSTTHLVYKKGDSLVRMAGCTSSDGGLEMRHVGLSLFHVA